MNAGVLTFWILEIFDGVFTITHPLVFRLNLNLYMIPLVLELKCSLLQ